jgi:hypothetical protein
LWYSTLADARAAEDGDQRRLVGVHMPERAAEEGAGGGEEGVHQLGFGDLGLHDTSLRVSTHEHIAVL